MHQGTPVERVKSAPASGKSRASATVVQGTRSSTPLDNGSTSIQSMPIPSASGRCEGEGFPPSVSSSIVRGPLSRNVLRDDDLEPAPGVGSIREHKAIERLAVHSQVHRALEAKPMTAKAQTKRRSNAVVRQPKSDLSRRQSSIEFDDLDTSRPGAELGPACGPGHRPALRS